MGFIRNNNVWKINKILAGISGGVKPEDVQDMIDTSIAPIETAIEGKQDTLTAGNGIEINENTISVKGWKIYNSTNWTELIDENKRLTKNVLIYYEDVPNSHNVMSKILPKGTYFNNNTLYFGQLIISGNYYSCYIYANSSTITSDHITLNRYYDSQISPQYNNGVWNVELHTSSPVTISKSVTFDYPYNSPFIVLLIMED